MKDVDASLMLLLIINSLVWLVASLRMRRSFKRHYPSEAKKAGMAETFFDKSIARIFRFFATR